MCLFCMTRIKTVPRIRQKVREIGTCYSFGTRAFTVASQEISKQGDWIYFYVLACLTIVNKFTLQLDDF